MTTHWIIAIGRPKLPVMSGNAMLTAVSSGTTEMPRPISTSRSRGHTTGGAPNAGSTRLRCFEGNDSLRRSCVKGHNGPAVRMMTTEFSLAIHGGAGTLRREAMGEERAARYHEGLRRALIAGR